jgi:hypothetical protein
MTALASFHHLYFPPVIFLTRQVGVEGNELEKASHAWNITDVVSSVLSESASHGQEFQRQRGSRHVISFAAQKLC